MLDVPLRVLTMLDGPAADALRHVLVAFTDDELPDVIVRRIDTVVPLERRLDAPFDGVPEDAVQEAILSVLRLVLSLRLRLRAGLN